jgi:hypothetical protein
MAKIRLGKAAAALHGPGREKARGPHSAWFGSFLVPKHRGDRGQAYPTLLNVYRRSCEASDDGPFFQVLETVRDSSKASPVPKIDGRRWWMLLVLGVSFNLQELAQIVSSSLG